ncbi:MAG TPA: exonuclease domain-containing protein [Burkholderiaceae bacterium]|nr:exonuclease domain-containing protein [Burkholderiaceae bacterium]
MNDQFVVVDCETTGVDEDDTVVEIAVVRLDDGAEFSSLINPGRPIPPMASAVHHLTDADVAGAPHLADLEGELRQFIGGRTLVAHNAAFDSRMLPALGTAPWLCTMRLAKHLYPEAPGFSNQVLRYWLGLAVDTRDLAPHRALADALVTAAVLRTQLAACRERWGFDGSAELVAKANSPARVEYLYFGKEHWGKRIADVPSGYLRWMIEKADRVDPDIRYSAECHLRRAA